MNGLLTQNLSPASLLVYVLVAGPAGGCFHYGARRLLGRVGRALARLTVLTLVIGAIVLMYKTGLLDHTITTGPADLNPYSAR